MRVRLRNPDREVELSGPRSVRDVLLARELAEEVLPVEVYGG